MFIKISTRVYSRLNGVTQCECEQILRQTYKIYKEHPNDSIDLEEEKRKNVK
jgi:hypothetical protein